MSKPIHFSLAKVASTLNEPDLSTSNWQELPLGRLLQYSQPFKYLVASKTYASSPSAKNPIPVITPGKSFIKGYTQRDYKVYRADEQAVILFDDFTAASQYVDFAFKVQNSATKILSVTDPQKYDVYFCYLLLQALNYQPQSHERQWISKVQHLKVRVPRLAVQLYLKELFLKLGEEIDLVVHELLLAQERKRKLQELMLIDVFSSKDVLTLTTKPNITTKLDFVSNQNKGVNLNKETNQTLETNQDEETDFTSNTYLSPCLRFASFAQPWQAVTLEQVVKIVVGKTPTLSNPAYWSGGTINWFTPREIGKQIYLGQSQKKVTPAGLAKCVDKVLPAGSLLFTSRADIGRYALLTQAACTNQGILGISPDPKALDSYFLYTYAFAIKRQALARARGSIFAEINKQQLATTKLYLPSLDEQVKIAQFFALIDQQIQNLEHLLQLYQQQKAAILARILKPDM
ncbi:restriction endonuclease subunit S [Psittacicella hinzii]|uniref:Type I restriction modification DNA specificity domain-containing protein n=1 Tax=Psittacicella hinzii TaxID=2028575 RepID=A0A3A1YG79_9GAMM|nr:restriction endonuclease subunit S [Psittacicella hinzii]RIY37152.1 hypothetical protein CKF58_05210 [Psittacicella hinzii]